MSTKHNDNDATIREYDFAEWDAELPTTETSNAVDLLDELRRKRVHAPSQTVMARYSAHYNSNGDGEHIVCAPNTKPNPTFSRSFRYGKEPKKHEDYWRPKSGAQVASRGTQCDIKPPQRTVTMQCQPSMHDINIQTHRGNTDAIVVKAQSHDVSVQASTNDMFDYKELMELITDLKRVQRAPMAPAPPVQPHLADGQQEKISWMLSELHNSVHAVMGKTDQVDAKQTEIMHAMRQCLTKHVSTEGGGEDQGSDEAFSKVAKLLEEIMNTVHKCSTSEESSKLFTLLVELNKASIDLRVDCQSIMKVISSVGKSKGYEEEHFIKINSCLKEILLVLRPSETPEMVIRRQLYAGQCRCSHIVAANLAIQRGSPQHVLPCPCQRCINDFKGRSFVQSLSLPMAFTADVVNTLGMAIECIERDDALNLELQLKACREKTGNNWSKKDYTVTYEALFHLALLWRSQDAAVYMTSLISLDMIVKGMKDEAHQYRLPSYIQKAIQARNLKVIEQICNGMDETEVIMVINTPVHEGDQKRYPLFEAARIGAHEIFTFLVMHGASFNVRENTRSILHELIWISHDKVESTKLDEWNRVIVSMLGVIYERAGHWWEKQMLYAEWNSCTQASSFNALNYLFSMQDSRGLNALQLAARYGTPEVTCKIVSNPPYEFIPDPMQFGHENGLKGYVVDLIESHLAQKKCSVLDSLVQRNPIDGAVVLSTDPFKSMIEDKWNHYQIFYVLWFIVYITYMLAYSACAVNRPIGVSTLAEMYQTNHDYARLTGELFIITLLPFFLYGEIRDGIRLGFSFPLPSFRTGMFRILNILFVICTLVILILRLIVSPNEDIPFAFGLILGWMLALEFLGAWKSIGMFAIIMHKVITIDVALKFFLVWFIAMAGTSTATFVAYQQSSSQINTNFQNDTFLMTPFSLTKISFALLDADYATEAFTPALGIILWIVFIFIFNIILFNLLIGMMADTYARMRVQINQSWIWVKANYALLMDRRLPAFLCVNYSQNNQRGFATGDSTKLRYLTIPRKRRVKEGNIVEVTEHVVLIATVDKPHAVDVKPEDIEIFAPKLITISRDD